MVRDIVNSGFLHMGYGDGVTLLAVLCRILMVAGDSVFEIEILVQSGIASRR
jgi:hypothetical protein